MTVPTAPTKRTFTVEAAKQVRTLAKPAYVLNLERAAANGPVPFDNAGAGFPWDVPSEAFAHHLRKLDELIDQAQHQISQLRELAQSMRAVAEGRTDEPHDPSIHEPPPPPEPVFTGEDKRFLENYVSGADVAELDEPLVSVPLNELIGTGPSVVPNVAMTWTCPDHGLFAEGVSRKGRPYRYCPRPECGKLDIMGIPTNA